MSFIFNNFFYNPLLNSLIYLYNTVGFEDLGVAIILLTLAIRIILFPIFQKSARQQTVMQHIQPEVRRIQEEYKKDRQKQAQALMELYREHQINPFSGFLFLLIQIPIMFALYRILTNLSKGTLEGLYSFVHLPQELNFSFLGLINLHESNIIIVVLAALAQYLQGRLGLVRHKGELTPAERMSQQMVFVAPLLTVFIFYSFPAAISLYWLAASVFSIIQQLIINKQLEHGKLGSITPRNS